MASAARLFPSSRFAELVDAWLHQLGTTKTAANTVAAYGRDLEGPLVVVDNAKVCAEAVRKVFGDHALIQPCTLHKRRNVTDHLPEAERGWVDSA